MFSFKKRKINIIDKYNGAIVGAIIGDAMGVPYENKSRDYMKINKVCDFMSGYRVHNQPEGTWSDDSSLILVTLNELSEGYNLNNICRGFIKWLDYGYMSSDGVVFDVGITTKRAIANMKNNIKPLECGYGDISDNGNGSLMRIIPLALYIHKNNINNWFNIVEELSSITHSNYISRYCCIVYVNLILELFKGNNILTAYKNTINNLAIKRILNKDKDMFNRIMSGDIQRLPINEINSSSYVLFSLEAALWVALNTTNYNNSILKAISLGGDTDTIACIVGGITGAAYGYNDINEEWKKDLRNIGLAREVISNFIDR